MRGRTEQRGQMVAVREGGGREEGRGLPEPSSRQYKERERERGHVKMSKHPPHDYI